MSADRHQLGLLQASESAPQQAAARPPGRSRRASSQNAQPVKSRTPFCCGYVLGGIASFGLVGLLDGPLIAAFLLTVIDLYESSYREQFFGVQRNRPTG